MFFTASFFRYMAHFCFTVFAVFAPGTSGSE